MTPENGLFVILVVNEPKDRYLLLVYIHYVDQFYFRLKFLNMILKILHVTHKDWDPVEVRINIRHFFEFPFRLRVIGRFLQTAVLMIIYCHFFKSFKK
uniref:Uncharacterized protein n=1 Tax=Lobelia linearis TaxID=2041131 RepID=A0A291EZ95_9ASTR|nr:hypothetical protein Lo_lin1Pt0850 [Lobelia linearis]ATG25179.1 hypothetical protein Lo_lin1Pt0850 [Lobelia linearis]